MGWSGFYNSVKIKLQEYSRSFFESCLLFSRSPILDRIRLYKVKKVYAIIGYDNKNCISFD